MKTHLRVLIPFLTFVLLFAACTPSEPVAPPNAQTTPATSGTDSLAGTRWTLVSWGAPSAETPVIGESTITLEFADGQINGSGGCNSYGGSYQTQGDTLLLGEIASTLMACVDNAVMEQETNYFAALQTAGDFQVNGDQLTIAYNGGVLTFVAAGAAPAEENAPPTATPAPEAAAQMWW